MVVHLPSPAKHEISDIAICVSTFITTCIYVSDGSMIGVHLNLSVSLLGTILSLQDLLNAKLREVELAMAENEQKMVMMRTRLVQQCKPYQTTTYRPSMGILMTHVHLLGLKLGVQLRTHVR